MCGGGSNVIANANEPLVDVRAWWVEIRLTRGGGGFFRHAWDIRKQARSRSAERRRRGVPVRAAALGGRKNGAGWNEPKIARARFARRISGA